MKQNLINVEHIKKADVMYEEGKIFYMGCGLPWKKIVNLETGIATFKDTDIVGLVFQDSFFWGALETTSFKAFWENSSLIFKFDNINDKYYLTTEIPKEFIKKIQNVCSFHAVLFDENQNIIDQFTVEEPSLCP